MKLFEHKTSCGVIYFTIDNEPDSHESIPRIDSDLLGNHQMIPNPLDESTRWKETDQSQF
jgi:hypothetical protein